MDITAWKKATRSRILAARDALGEDERKRLSAAISRRLIELPEFGSARSVAGYLSFGSEFDSAAFVAAVLAGGKRLLLPRIDRAHKVMHFHVVTELQGNLVAGTWGIMEPDPRCCARADLNEVDLMLVPGLAFTTRCERLGYGGGFYDAAIEMTPAHARKIAAAFSIQLVDSLLVEPHDRRVDMVVTESGSYVSGEE